MKIEALKHPVCNTFAKKNDAKKMEHHFSSIWIPLVHLSCSDITYTPAQHSSIIEVSVSMTGKFIVLRFPSQNQFGPTVFQLHHDQSKNRFSHASRHQQI